MSSERWYSDEPPIARCTGDGVEICEWEAPPGDARAVLRAAREHARAAEHGVVAERSQSMWIGAER